MQHQQFQKQAEISPKKSLWKFQWKTLTPQNKQTSVEETLHPQYHFHGLISNFPVLPFSHRGLLFFWFVFFGFGFSLFVLGWFFLSRIAVCFSSSGQESSCFFISPVVVFWESCTSWGSTGLAQEILISLFHDLSPLLRSLWLLFSFCSSSYKILRVPVANWRPCISRHAHPQFRTF